MAGMEYILLHVQEPILYVIRKQHRHSPTQFTPLADYYIIAGVVYQAPDLYSVVNSRLVIENHNNFEFEIIVPHILICIAVSCPSSAVSLRRSKYVLQVSS